jgi:hypothetical protein
MHNEGVVVDKNRLKNNQSCSGILTPLPARFQDEINYFYNFQKLA